MIVVYLHMFLRLWVECAARRVRGGSVVYRWRCSKAASLAAYWQRRRGFISSCVELSQIAWPRGHRPARRRRHCRHRRRRNSPVKLFHWKIRRPRRIIERQPWRFVATSGVPPAPRGCHPTDFITVKYWHLSLMYLPRYTRIPKMSLVTVARSIFEAYTMTCV